MSKTPEPNLAEMFLQMADSMRQIIELVAGYKSNVMEAGFNEEAATEMTVCLHNELIRKMFSAQVS